MPSKDHQAVKLTVTFLLVLFVALPSIVSSTYFSQLALGHASPALAYSAAVVAEVALPNRVGTSAGLSTGPLIYDSNKSYVYVASQGCNSSACSGSWMIYAISDENNSVLAGIELGANSSVVSMAFNPSMGYVYVLTAYVNSSNFYPVSGVLVVISDSSNTILNELYIGNCSMGEILYDQGNDCIYVFGNNLITGSFVSVISAETYSFVANITSEPFYYPGDAAAYDPVDG
ncbi:MAG TPA: hypothetical protein VEC08_04625, partial [Nitrososphaerales archaeon]|nr:hypothetical protein [Nitrososphaerales archaeon]